MNYQTTIIYLIVPCQPAIPACVNNMLAVNTEHEHGSVLSEKGQLSFFV